MWRGAKRASAPSPRRATATPTASPRRLGDLLLRALRNARTEDEAAAGLCALLGAVEPGSCRRAEQEPE